MRRATGVLAAVMLALITAGCGLEERIPAEVVSVNQSQPLGNQKGLEADVRLDVGTLEIASEKSGKAYAIDLDYDKASYRPEIRFEEGSDTSRLSFKLESLQRADLRADRHPNRLRLNLTDSLPVKLSVNTGVGDARLSLSGLRISSLDLESGVGGSRISIYEANPVPCDHIRIKNGVGSLDAVGLGNLNFRAMEFEGGVGGANLDFTGDWRGDADISIQVGVGGVTVRMPRTVGVKVDTQKHFLSGFHLDGFTKRDSLYYSENYDTAKCRVSLRVVTGVGGFKITWV
ncbi:MAG: hypothetical protein HXY20_12590 [Acidobacteria bacterium]|nr:hypothetical protein [Acidobacteriota bacterium]